MTQFLLFPSEVLEMTDSVVVTFRNCFSDVSNTPTKNRFRAKQNTFHLSSDVSTGNVTFLNPSSVFAAFNFFVFVARCQRADSQLFAG